MKLTFLLSLSLSGFESRQRTNQMVITEIKRSANRPRHHSEKTFVIFFISLRRILIVVILKNKTKSQFNALNSIRTMLFDGCESD